MTIHLPSLHRRWIAAAFRLLLIASLWDGPVVFGHTHSSSSAALAEHVARYHADDQEPAQLGWHWHWVSTGGCGASGCEGDDEPASPPPQRTEQYGPQRSTGFEGLDVVVEVPAAIGSIRTLSCRESGGYARLSFLETYCAARSRQQLLCRLSC